MANKPKGLEPKLHKSVRIEPYKLAILMEDFHGSMQAAFDALVDRYLESKSEAESANDG